MNYCEVTKICFLNKTLLGCIGENTTPTEICYYSNKLIVISSHNFRKDYNLLDSVEMVERYNPAHKIQYLRTVALIVSIYLQLHKLIIVYAYKCTLGNNINLQIQLPD